MKISDSVKYVGVNDHEIDLFEGQFEVPLGMAYNSYVIIDDKIAVMDSVDRNFGSEWLKNIDGVLEGKTPDYLIVQHMEMDHSANVLSFMQKFPEAKIAASKMAFTMMKNMFGTDFSDRQIVIAEGSKIELGKHTLNFITAPNVHWPEVIMTYESSEKILFSADAFGKFGANDKEDPEGWACEARRYYFGIVGKFGSSVQALLKKASNLEIQKICSLHGPVLILKSKLTSTITAPGHHTMQKQKAFSSLTLRYTETQNRQQKNLRNSLNQKAVLRLPLQTLHAKILMNV